MSQLPRMKQYRYPLGALTAESDYLNINVKKKTPKGLINNLSGSPDNRSNVFGELNNTATVRTTATIILPLPEGISDSNGADWGESGMNKLEQAAVAGSVDLMNTSLKEIKNIKDMGDKIEEFGTKAGNRLLDGGNALNDPAIAASIQSALANSVLGIFGSNVTRQALLSRTTGKVINPHLELFYKGPKIRDFQFTFKMTPRSQEEAKEIKKIINRFKYFMAPSTDSNTGGGGWFIETPDVFDLDFKRGGKNHPYLPTLKTCALTDMQVNYSDSSTQNFASYEDGSPVSTLLSLSFKELDPIYKSDYVDNGFADDELENGPGY